MASHVCTAWRTLCITTPTLWARQVGRLSAAAEEFLIRSANAPIDITWATEREVPATWYSIQRPRIRAIDWSTERCGKRSSIRSKSSSFLRGLISSLLPNLRSLILCFPNKVMDLDFALDAPRLRHLQLRSMEWNRAFAVNSMELRSLDIRGCRLTINSLIRLLRNTPRLGMMEVSFSKLTLTGSELQMQQAAPVKLSHLKSIAFHCNQDRSGKILGILFGALDVRPELVAASVIGRMPHNLALPLLQSVLEDPKGINTCCLGDSKSLKLYASNYMSSRNLLLCNPKDVRASLQDVTARILRPLRRLTQLSCITIFVIHLGHALPVGPTDVTLRDIMCLLESVEIYGVDSRERFPHDGHREDYLRYEGFISALSPGPLALEARRTRKPFPRLTLIHLRINPEDSRLINLVYHVLGRRDDAMMRTRGVLCLPLLSRQVSTTALQLQYLVHEVRWADNATERLPDEEKS